MITQEQENRLIALLNKIKDETKEKGYNRLIRNSVKVITDDYIHIELLEGILVSATIFSDSTVKIAYHAGVDLENVIQHLEKEVPNAIKLINEP